MSACTTLQARHASEIKEREARHRVELAELERQIEREFSAQLANVEAKAATELSSFPMYIQNLLKAERLGHIADHPACVDIISGIATCLAKNTTRGRVLNETEKQFYGILLNSGSPWAEKFVSHNLMGPHLRQIKELRAKRSPEIALEVGEAAVAEVLVPLLFDHSLHETPGGISEDGTTANRHLDWERVEPTAELAEPVAEPAEPAAAAAIELDAAGEFTHRQGILSRERARDELRLREHAEAGSADFESVVTALDVSVATWRKGLRIWGLVSGTGKGYIVVYSLAELLEVFSSKTKVVARYVYVYTWIPAATSTRRGSPSSCCGERQQIYGRVVVAHVAQAAQGVLYCQAERPWRSEAATHVPRQRRGRAHAP